MNKMIKTFGAASLLAMAVGSASVSADVLPFLTFDQSAGWSNQNFTFNGAQIGLTGLAFANPTGVDAPANTFADMSWTSTVLPFNNTSSINLTSFDSSDSPSNGVDGDGDALWEQNEFWAIDQLLQTNNRLSFSSANVPNPLWIADTLANLRIFSDAGIAPENLLIADLNSKTTIEFWETSNDRVAPIVCGSPNPLGTGCDDIFRVASFEFDPLFFNLNGYKYTINFGLAPGPSTSGNPPVVTGTTLVCTSSSDPGCAGVNVTAGEIWVFSPESAPGTSSLFVTMAWSAERISVPEPSVLALFGAGILGLGLAGRRRKQRHQQ